MYWAEALAEQNEDVELRARFGTLAELMGSNETRINEELIAVQGSAVDIDGYYMPDDSKPSRVMRPSETLNGILGGLARA